MQVEIFLVRFHIPRRFSSPSVVLAFPFARLESSSLMTSVWPPQDARWSGVMPRAEKQIANETAYLLAAK